MTKLTVAEASKRGYATGLSILQAVQKNWLSAEKGVDGQLMVDAADLERIFGLPDTAARAPLIPDESAGSVAARPLSENGAQQSTPHAFEDEGEENSGDSDGQSATTGRADDVQVAVAPPPPSPAPSAPAAVADDHAELRAEIDRLRSALDDEKRRVAALLDVLAQRVLPPDEPAADTITVARNVPQDDATRSVPDEGAGAYVPDAATESGVSDGDTESAAPADDTGSVEPDGADADRVESEDDIEREAAADDFERDTLAGEIGSNVSDDDAEEDEPYDDTEGDVLYDDTEAAAFDEDPVSFAARPVRFPPASAAAERENEPHMPSTAAADESAPRDATLPRAANEDHAGLVDAPDDDDDDISVPPIAADLSVRPIAADPQARLRHLTRPQIPAEERSADAQRNSALFWNLWWLMSLVWVAPIGAWFWFVLDLPADLAVIATWIRGTATANAPEVVEATRVVTRAARDTLGPPLILLVVMLVARAVFRLMRR